MHTNCSIKCVNESVNEKLCDLRVENEKLDWDFSGIYVFMCGFS